MAWDGMGWHGMGWHEGVVTEGLILLRGEDFVFTGLHCTRGSPSKGLACDRREIVNNTIIMAAMSKAHLQQIAHAREGAKQAKVNVSFRALGDLLPQEPAHRGANQCA
eukprot:2463656-Pyramimonas_sp.AAC.2